MELNVVSRLRGVELHSQPEDWIYIQGLYVDFRINSRQMSMLQS